MKLLKFQHSILDTLNNNDTLTVLVKGLGIDQLLYHYIHTNQLYTSTKLYIILNLSEYQRILINEQLLSQSNTDTIQSIRQLNNEWTAADRQQCYASGGVISVTNRIFIIDLLTKNLSIDLISGIIVLNAHTITEVSTEIFILRVYKQYNKNGFIHAFSDNPGALCKGLFKLTNLMRQCYLNKLLIWPRFHADILSTLDTVQPNVIQCPIPMTNLMQLIQQAIIDIIDICITQLKKDSTTRNAITNLDIQITVESALTIQFDQLIRNELQAQWNRVSIRSKQLIADIQLMRKCLTYLINYDCITFYRYLMNVRQQCAQSTYSVWLYIDAGDRLFKYAKQRVYSYVDPANDTKLKRTASNNSIHSDNTEPYIKLNCEQNPKWQLVIDILDEIKHNNKHNATRILIVCRDTACSRFLAQYIDTGAQPLLHNNWRKYLFGLRLHKRNFVIDGVQLTALQQETLLLKRTVEQMIHSMIEKRVAHEITTTEALADGTLQTHSAVKRKSSTSLQNSKTKLSTEKLNTLKSGKTLDDEDTNEVYEPLDLDIIVAEESNNETEQTDDTVVGYNNNNSASIIDSDFKLNQLSQDITVVDQLNEHSIGEYILPITNTSIEIHTVESLNNVLYSYQPTHVIMYDPDIQCIRELELYQAQLDAQQRISIYFTLYDNSVEDQKFRTTVNLEKQAFERLIHEKAYMVLQTDEMNSKPHDTTELTTDKREKLDFAADEHAPTHNAYAALLPQQTVAEKRTGGIQTKVQNRILVDMREFRSSLPSLLHRQGNDIVPLTLELGDYILTPTLVVERKSIPDLFGSFQSGRLYNQITSLLRYYKNPCLLIEFDRNKPFALLQNRNELEHEINQKSVISKMCLLILHFPAMRILWSRDALMTAQLFNILKTKQLQPEIIHAVTTKDTKDNPNTDTMIDINDDSDEKYAYTMLPQDILKRLPGVNQLNIRNIMANTTNLQQLCHATLEQLTEWMSSTTNATKLYTFLHAEISTIK